MFFSQRWDAISYIWYLQLPWRLPAMGFKSCTLGIHILLFQWSPFSVGEYFPSSLITHPYPASLLPNLLLPTLYLSSVCSHTSLINLHLILLPCMIWLSCWSTGYDHWQLVQAAITDLLSNAGLSWIGLYFLLHSMLQVTIPNQCLRR